MAARMIVLALCVAAVVGGGVPAAKYPAGVNPHACPNYPYCDNVALAAHGAGHHGVVAPYAAPAYAAYGHHGAGVHGAVAAKYPAGVDPHTCPNYPYCDNVALAVHGAGHGAHGWAGAAHGLAGVHGWAGAAHGLAGAHGWAGAYAAPAWGHGVVAAHHGAHHGAGAHYPAGVDPHSCPNYPYCHNGAVHGAHGWAGVH